MEPLSFIMKIHPRLIVRTPLCITNTSFGEEEILALLGETWFREAIYIASPALFDACQELMAGKIIAAEKRKKIIQSLAKYYARMSSRCTPFGLFASCSQAGWGERTAIVVSHRPKRRTRLDMFYLCRLVQELQQNSNIRNRLRFYPNTSIYFLGNEIRYIETLYIDDRRTYRISAVDNSEYAGEILRLAGKGATICQLAEHLLKYEVEPGEAVEFIESMIESQLLTTEWEPALTGKEYMCQVMETLELINRSQPDPEITYIAGLLRNIEQQLQLLDENNINEPAQYTMIADLIKMLGVPFEEEKIFQVDAVQGIKEESTVDNHVQQSLQDVLYLFEKIILYYPNPLLEQFRKRFKERYEDREVQLAEVLDTETGIGFSDPSNMRQDSPLLDGLVLQAGAGKELNAFNTWDNYWMKYLVKVQKESKYTITLGEKEIEALKTTKAEWPPSISVAFRLTNHGKVFIEHIGGSSAINLAGRFTYASEAIDATINEITQQEALQNEDVIFAEILHMPESRTGNVLQHRACRNYEIPYLAKSSVAKDFRIDIADLWVSVVNDRIILRSKRLNKEVIPRLSNAHNFSMSALPVYHFLCQLQTQHVRQGASFRFGAAENYFRFLPRVEYKNCIVHPATWLLDKKDIERLTEVAENDQAGAFSIFNVGWNLPRYFVLSDGDNELLVDSSNPLLLQSFIRLIKNRQSVRLTEYLGGESKGIADEQGRKYNAQFVALLVKDEPTYQAIAPRATGNLPLRFYPGSEWLYLKFYCGFKTADRIIAETIAPMAAKWQKQGLIRKWFFIRYYDPRFHLRIRFLLEKPSDTGILLEEMQQAASHFNSADFIPKIQTDTYEREALRYGYDTMELSESIFHYDSMAVAELLTSENMEDNRWLWASRIIHELVEDFGFTNEQKLQYLQQCRDKYAREFTEGPSAKKQLDKKYRSISSRLYEFLKSSDNSPADCILQKRRSQLKPVISLVLQYRQAGRLTPPIQDFLASHIHMMLNRLFIADARLQEWILYDFMSRYYQSIIARSKQVRTAAID
jgi:lantibiotic biosynthesis protein